MRSFTLLLLLCGATMLSAQNEQIFRLVDEKATFPYNRQQCESYVDACAEAAMQAYIKSAIQYDSTMGEGAVTVQFVVEKDGAISQPKVTNSLSPGADAEAVRLVNGMNNMSQAWRAAWHKNGFVRSYSSVVIQFRIPRNPPNTGPVPNPTTGLAPPPPTDPKRLSEKGSVIHKMVDKMPMFPYPGKNCEEPLETYQNQKKCADIGMLEYVYGHVRYHPEDEENRIEGMAVISFIIEADGSITSPEIVRNPGGYIGQQALNVVLQMIDDDIHWIPGQHDGEFVAVQFNLPIKFKVP